MTSAPPNGAPHSYLRDAVLTATQEQLHLMLYDGAIRFALQGKDALAVKNYEESYNKLSRAQAIILEMQNGLRHEVNPELCERMAAIYAFLYRKLVDASVHRDLARIDDALKILRYQRETWVMVMDKVTGCRAAQQDANNQAAGDLEATLGAGLCVEG